MVEENLEDRPNQMNPKETYFNSLHNVSAADGRHCLITFPLREFFSEHALHKYRTLVEIKHLIKLSETSAFGLPPLNDWDKEELMKIFHNFDAYSSQAVCEYDHFGRNLVGATEHDVKSVELFIKEKLTETRFEYLIPWIHFGFTSEDVNNIAYNCMLKESLHQVWMSQLKEICNQLKALAVEYKNTPLLSRTHGQPASPTTFGKEMAVFLNRITNEIIELNKLKLSSKMNGAVGNYNAHQASFPNFDWIKYSTEFVESFGFEIELLTNQRGPKNRVIMLFQNMHRINSIIKDLDQDLWLYVSRDLVLQKKVESHVGSSVMPHKINPWLIECGEGNVEISNALLEVFCRELDISRLQRDLSDHDHERNYGAAFAYSLVALNYTSNFLKKIQVNEALMLEELKNNSQVLSEAYQTILRAEGHPEAYGLFKDIFRNNQKINPEEIAVILSQIKIDERTKEKLKSLKVEDYVGKAGELAEIAVERYDAVNF